MKNHLLKIRLTPFLFLLALVVFCAGCETVKGMGRDIKNADEWVRGHVV